MVLECVAEVQHDPWVQGQLQAFASRHQYHIAQQVLQLQDTSGARRTWWWAVLSSQDFGPVQLRPLPADPQHRTVASIMPTLAPWPEHEIRQLLLTEHEVRVFSQALGDLDTAVLRSDLPMPTALHGWGNQLMPCPCGCRRAAFTNQRIRHPHSADQVR